VSQDDISPTLRLAIGTWFFKLLVGDSPGGLPADFFTYAASALLVFDEIICDVEAFESEMDFASGHRGRTQWLSSTLYRELQQAGILRLVSYRAESREIIARFQAEGAAQRVSEIMEQERMKLRSNPRTAQRPISPELRRLNACFLIELARKGLAPYDWREGHLRPAAMDKILSSTAARKNNDGGGYGLERAARLILPHVTVLQSPKWVASVDAAAYRGYRANVARERLPLYLWMYGDPEWTRAKYNEWRLGPEFRAADKAFDRAREAHARKNLEAVLKVRERTANERRAIQALLSRSIEQHLRPASLSRELEEHVQVYETLKGSHRISLNLVVATAGFAGLLVSATLQSLSSGLVGAEVAHMVEGTSTLAHLTGVVQEVRHRAQAKKDEPIGWFVSEVRKRLGE
jgi:hypothetical protein